MSSARHAEVCLFSFAALHGQQWPAGLVAEAFASGSTACPSPIQREGRAAGALPRAQRGEWAGPLREGLPPPSPLEGRRGGRGGAVAVWLKSLMNDANSRRREGGGVVTVSHGSMLLPTVLAVRQVPHSAGGRGTQR